MTKKLISTKAVNYIVAALILFLVVSVFVVLQSNPGSESFSYSTKRLLPIDPVVSDSLPNYEYKRLKKEIELSREMKNGEKVSWDANYLFLGFTTQKRCDTCSRDDFFNKVDVEFDYLIKLNWWYLDTGLDHRKASQTTVYFVKNGQSFLRKQVCKLKKVEGNNVNYHCFEVDVPVSFRYDSEQKAIMIPVSKATLDVFKPIFMVVSWPGAVTLCFVILTSFLKILIDIRNGGPFSIGNVKRLKWLAIFCFSVPTVLFLLNFLIRLIFHRYFTEDVKLSLEAWLIFWKPFVLGIIFAALHSAFKRGKQLKEEQDLTI